MRKEYTFTQVHEFELKNVLKNWLNYVAIVIISLFYSFCNVFENIFYKLYFKCVFTGMLSEVENRNEADTKKQHPLRVLSTDKIIYNKVTPTRKRRTIRRGVAYAKLRQNTNYRTKY